MKLRLERMYNVYGVLESVHHWTPLLIISVLLLSKLSPFLSGLLNKLAQVSQLSTMSCSVTQEVVFVYSVGWRYVPNRVTNHVTIVTYLQQF